MLATRGALHINEDVLHEILIYSGPKEQAVAAQVSHVWTLPAQRALYRSITFHTWDGAPVSSGQRLVETLKNHDHLRALVRQICIHSSSEEDPLSRLDWVDLFPERSLRNFTYICWPRSAFNPALLRKAAIHTVPHLTASGPMNAHGLRACFELPLMETLELDLSEWDSHCAKRRVVSKMCFDASKAPKLRHLYMNVGQVYEPIVNLVLAAFAPQLHSLHIHLPSRKILEGKRSAAAWADEFAAHIRRARDLSRIEFSGFPKLHTFMSDTARLSCRPMVLDWILSNTKPTHTNQRLESSSHTHEVAQQSAIEHLSCVEDLYTEQLFLILPPTVKVLEFYVDSETYGYEYAVLYLLARVKREGLLLRRLTFFASEERRALFQAIEAACEEHGVGFEFVPVSVPLHNPPTRPVIAWD